MSNRLKALIKKTQDRETRFAEELEEARDVRRQKYENSRMETPFLPTRTMRPASGTNRSASVPSLAANAAMRSASVAMQPANAAMWSASVAMRPANVAMRPASATILPAINNAESYWMKSAKTTRDLIAQMDRADSSSGAWSSGAWSSGAWSSGERSSTENR